MEPRITKASCLELEPRAFGNEKIEVINRALDPFSFDAYQIDLALGVRWCGAKVLKWVAKQIGNAIDRLTSIFINVLVIVQSARDRGHRYICPVGNVSEGNACFVAHLRSQSKNNFILFLTLYGIL